MRLKIHCLLLHKMEIIQDYFTHFIRRIINRGLFVI